MLENIKSPRDLDGLAEKDIGELAGEIRDTIIDTVSHNGGHLSSNLGDVEMTIALHRVFDVPRDTLIFDVGRQCYAHKLLTARRCQLRSVLRAQISYRAATLTSSR